MNSLELVNQLYKPYRITKVGKSTIIEAMEGKFVVKPKCKKDIKELFEYLKTRDFLNFPKLVDDSRSDIDIYEYIEDANYPADQKAIDMIKLVAKMHSRTSYEHEVREDKYKEIYEKIKGNLLYYKEKFEAMTVEIEDHIFMSPSEYLFIRNSAKLNNQIGFCLDRLDNWYDSIKDKRTRKLSVVHNRLSLDHYLKGEKEALISWDSSSVDSPILDIYNFYQKEALNLEFSSILKEYFKHYDLEDSDKELLFVLLCIPKDFSLEGSEFMRCKSIGESLDYSFKTEYLARPYYAINNEE